MASVSLQFDSLRKKIVLTWDVIIETLVDDDFMQRTDADERAIAAHLVFVLFPKNHAQDPNHWARSLCTAFLSLEMSRLAVTGIQM